MADQREMMGRPGAIADFGAFDVGSKAPCAIPSEGRVTTASGCARGTRLLGEGDDLRCRDPWIVYGATRDIGEQRLAALKLRESEAELRTLVRGIPPVGRYGSMDVVGTAMAGLHGPEPQ